MFRFWSNDSRGSGQTLVEAHESMQLDITIRSQQIPPPIAATIAESRHAGPSQPPASPTKRSRDEDEDDETHDAPLPKRSRQAEGDAVAAVPSSDDVSFASYLSDGQDRAREAIQFHFGLEILHKHEELRLIDQELAKCQIALEQLRRCHLIPYPLNCPTPDQMVDICNGKGPTIKQQGKEVPRWAAPFGVVDGPYARHYAKWLIPDSMFDGMLPEWRAPYQASRPRVTSEGRTTRNSIGDIVVKGRPVRGNAGQKLQALTTSAQPPREKGACILERKKDGKMVKLVCVDCRRGDFLSIQGFINHCRIAHRRDFKSHEEAAIHCGHPIDANDAAAAPQQTAVEAQSSTTAATPVSAASPFTPASASAVVASSMPPAQPSGLVHPLARADTTRQETYVALQSRIKTALELYHQGKLPGVDSIPGLDTKAERVFVASSETPYLSALMRSKKFSGDLQQMIADAKTRDVDDMSSPGEEADDMMDMDAQTPMSQVPMMRMPARTAIAPPVHATRPASSKGPSPPVLAYSRPILKQDGVIAEEDVDMESPNTVASNVAPSLVSDDSDYESDDGSSESGASDSLHAESISDVTEINMDDDVETPRLRHQPCVPSTTVRLRKEDSKTVTLVSPVKNTAKERRHRNVEKL